MRRIRRQTEQRAIGDGRRRATGRNTQRAERRNLSHPTERPPSHATPPDAQRFRADPGTARPPPEQVWDYNQRTDEPGNLRHDRLGYSAGLHPPIDVPVVPRVRGRFRFSGTAVSLLAFSGWALAGLSTYSCTWAAYQALAADPEGPR